MQTLLVTGGAGFIGSNFIHYWSERYPNDTIVNVDKLTYAGDLRNLDGVANDKEKKYFFEKADICDKSAMVCIFRKYKPAIVVNFAAESHNSRAIIFPAIFFQTNVIGTQTLLDVAVEFGVHRFHHVSTCEVFGDLELDSTEIFHEGSPLDPRTPYSASKAAADHAVIAYNRTYNLPITISNCANNYGPRQFIEKVIPLFITRALKSEPIPVYVNANYKREWIYVEDHCRAIDMILRSGKIGETYNVGTGEELEVGELANLVVKATKRSQELIISVTDRPSHDKRYLLDSTKIQSTLGWEPSVTFKEGLVKTVKWYTLNQEWREGQEQRLEIDESQWEKYTHK
ncbi:MAG: dTDP-glucose 4,6-dehydratase [Chlorobi bacterium]|nr:dTDP-glucose 4,6-dehydratase [Chlorobiota bacterium]